MQYQGLAMATICPNGGATTLTEGTSSVGRSYCCFCGRKRCVYVAGYEQKIIMEGPTFAKYWKNGVPVKLSTASSAATGIAVFDNETGWENNGTYSSVANTGKRECLLI